MKNRTSFAYKIMIGVGTLWLLLSLLGCATASSDNLTDINELESISAEHNSIISEAKYREFLKKTLSSKGYSEKDFNDNAETLLLKHYPEVLLVDSKIKSYRCIYTLDNEIPAGLILYNISYEDLKSTKSDYVKDEDHVLRYGPYSLYGYSCDIEFRFNDDDILDRIYVWGQYERDVITFKKSDIERIGTEIEKC